MASHFCVQTGCRIELLVLESGGHDVSVSNGMNYETTRYTRGIPLHKQSKRIP